jgi:hypothetical protein
LRSDGVRATGAGTNSYLASCTHGTADYPTSSIGPAAEARSGACISGPGTVPNGDPSEIPIYTTDATEQMLRFPHSAGSWDMTVLVLCKPARRRREHRRSHRASASRLGSRRRAEPR